MKVVEGCETLGPEGVNALLREFNKGALASIHTLHIIGNRMGDDGITALAEACGPKRAFPKLEELSLCENAICEDGMQALASAVSKGALASLKILNLQENQIGSAGVSAFAIALESGALPKVTYVSLVGNPGNAELVERALRDRKENK